MSRHTRLCLLVGGPADGEWHHVETDRETWRVVDRATLPQYSWIKPRPPEEAALEHEYRRVPFKEASTETWVYVHPTVAHGEVLRTLLKGYRRVRGSATMDEGEEIPSA